ncbi:SdiA-regulated domain-containing protein [bacterium]|nr:SdiA-regulated domain-containing protein [bacterium]
MKNLSLIFVLLFFWACSSDETKKELFTYKSYFQTNISNPSGLAYDSFNNYFLVVSDKNDSVVYRLDTKGNLVDSILLSFDGQDFEGISFNQKTKGFFIADEGDSVVYVVDSLGKKQTKISVPISVAYDLQSGFEGIAFDSQNDVLYLAKEKNPTLLLKLKTNGEIIWESQASYGLEDFSDLFFSENKLYILSDKSSKLVILDLKTNKTQNFSFPVKNAEGVCLDSEGNLWISNETENRLYKFTKN